MATKEFAGILTSMSLEISQWRSNTTQSHTHICRAYHHYHTEITIIHSLLCAPEVRLLQHLTKVITATGRPLTHTSVPGHGDASGQHPEFRVLHIPRGQWEPLCVCPMEGRSYGLWEPIPSRSHWASRPSMGSFWRIKLWRAGQTRLQTLPPIRFGVALEIHVVAER